MSEVMDAELASLLNLSEIVNVIEHLTRRVLNLQDVIGEEQRKQRDLMAHLAVERVEAGQLAARVAMLETSMAPPWTDADLPVTDLPCPECHAQAGRECEVWCIADQAPRPTV